MMIVIKNTADGEVCVVNDLDGYEESKWEVLSDDAAEPLEHDEWDEVESAWKVNGLAKADADAGADHIAKAHLLKQLEAALVLSGVPLTHGILFEEAQALGLTLTDLAQEVHGNASSFRATEVARREVKTEARGGNPFG